MRSCRRRVVADPGDALRHGEARGFVGGVEVRDEAQHAIVRGAAATGPDGDRRAVTAAVVDSGQGGDEVLPDLGGCVNGDPSGPVPRNAVAGSDCGERAVHAGDGGELGPAAGWQGHSLRARGRQTIATVGAVRTSGEGGRSI